MRPRVICHMAASIDGRIVTDGWPDSPAIRREYEQIHTTYEADAWMCGRITMQPFAGGVRSDADVKLEYVGPPRDDYIAPGDHESFAVAIDPSGRLASIALAWLMAQQPWIVPIPGTTQMAHMLDNIGASDVRFTSSELAELNRGVSAIEIRGARLPDQVLVFSGVEVPPKK